VKVLLYSLFHDIKESMDLIEGSQASPVFPSDKSSVRKKMDMEN
jgi:hypothetical protein